MVALHNITQQVSREGGKKSGNKLIMNYLNRKRMSFQRFSWRQKEYCGTPVVQSLQHDGCTFSSCDMSDSSVLGILRSHVMQSRWQQQCKEFVAMISAEEWHQQLGFGEIYSFLPEGRDKIFPNWHYRFF